MLRNLSLTSCASRWENKCSTAAKICYCTWRIKGKPCIFIVRVFLAKHLLLAVRRLGDAELMLSTVFGPFILLIWVWAGRGNIPERFKPECQEILLCWIMQEIKKRAAGTSETLRDEELWDPLCTTSVRAMNLCFVHPVLVLCFFLYYLMAAMMPSQQLCCECMNLQGRISSTVGRSSSCPGGICPPQNKR